jgi:ADP-ribose pyrophosphatase YjhB (NUDIX family)
MPGRIVPGAGEHMEPGKDINVKKGVLRTIKEELGIPKTTLTQCYLLPLGRYDDQGRDPRYHTYDCNKWGLVRGSETNAHILYIKSDTDNEPTEIDPEDTVEINKKWWAPLDSVLTDYNIDRWMIADHRKFIPDTISMISSFNQLSKIDQQMSLLFVPDDSLLPPPPAPLSRSMSCSRKIIL